MRCLFVAAGMLFGGAERGTSILAKEWAKQGVETRILLTRTDATSQYELPINTVVLSCRDKVISSKVKQVTIIREIRRLCKAWKPDIVISFYNDLCALTAIATLGLNIPLIYSERNDPNKTNQRLMDKLYRAVVEYAADKVVFQTEGAKQHYRKFVQKKSRVILNPLDTSNFPEHDPLAANKEIVTVGRLEPQKNHKLLINAFASFVPEHPEYRLVIYGSGSLQKELEMQISQLGLSHCIELAGATSAVHEKIKDASLFVLTSDYEGLPNVLMEAMAVGLPCISTDCSPGGARELIENGQDGIIVPCGEADILAEAMAGVLSDSNFADMMGRNARRIRERVASEKIAGEWLKFIWQE